jgi:hypothetical protein
VYDARTPSEATGAPAVAQFSAAGRETNKSRDAIYTVHTLVGELPSGNDPLNSAFLAVKASFFGAGSWDTHL